MFKQQFNLEDYFEKYYQKIEDLLHANLPCADSINKSELNQAIEYAVFSGGKRIRPVLTLLGAELFSKEIERIFPAAVAVEFIHTSSLIFDDLPSMDNSSVRRGKTSLHKKFGEGTAILSAIALLNSAYQLVFKNQNNSLENCVKSHAEMVECIGVMGMIGGQAVDLAIAQNRLKSLENSIENEKVKTLKTSALMRLSICLGAILLGAESSKLSKLKKFAESLGEAYQLRDDLFDIHEDNEILLADKKTNEIDFGISETQNALQDKVRIANQILLDNFSDSEARNVLLQISESLAKPIV